MIDGAEAEDHEAGPPPTPFERSRPLGSSDRRRRLGARTVIVGLSLAGAATGLVAGLVLSDSVSLTGARTDGQESTPPDEVAASALVVLLEDIIGSEGIMLAFNDGVGASLREAQDEATALAAIAAAASEAAADLVAARPGIVERSGGGSVDDVRSAYLPHLDAWIDYLEALAERPVLLFSDGEQQPFLLLINSTAVDFSDALEAVLAQDLAPEVAELVERILDDGFRGFGENAQL